MQTIAQQLKITKFPFIIKDNKGREIYWENLNGYWLKTEYDDKGHEIYWENSCGHWNKREYDNKGNEVYWESSKGMIIDNRPKCMAQHEKPIEIPSDEPKQTTLTQKEIIGEIIGDREVLTPQEPLIPIDAHSFEVFAIKDCKESPTDKQAFIGFKIANGDFHFIGVPYTEPKQQKEKTIVTLLMEELDAEMKMGTKMVLNWDKYLEMEKEQITDAHIEGQRVFDKHPHTQWTNDQAEQYYNETFTSTPQT